MFIELAIILVFPALMILAGSMDLFTMTIPNRIPLALVAGFACLAPLAGMGWETLAFHVAVAAAMLVIGIGMFAAGWMGGGDAKVFAAASLWMGLEHVYEYLMVSAIFGGILTLFMLFMRTFPLPAGLAGHKWMTRLHDAGTGVPYGIALAAGGLAVYPYIGWIQLLRS